MDRKIDLKKYLPQVAKSEEMIEIMDTESKAFQDKWEDLKSVSFNRYISTADENGIFWFERVLNIISKGSLEDRRKKVFVEWNKKVVWTHRTLEDWLDMVVGVKKYRMILEYNEYSLVLSVFVNNQNLNNMELAKSLREIIPANLLIDIRILMSERLIYQDKLKSFETKFWMTNQIPSGRVPTQSYRGIKSRDTLRMGSSGRISDNKPYKTNEIRANNTPNKGGNR